MIKFRDFISEGRLTGRFSISGTPVFSVSSWIDLKTVLTKSDYHEVRGKLFGQKMVVWDAAMHTHDEYSREFEFGGVQIVITWDTRDNSMIFMHQGKGTHDEVTRNPLVQRILDQFTSKGGHFEVDYIY